MSESRIASIIVLTAVLLAIILLFAPYLRAGKPLIELIPLTQAELRELETHRKIKADLEERLRREAEREEATFKRILTSHGINPDPCAEDGAEVEITAEHLLVRRQPPQQVRSVRRGTSITFCAGVNDTGTIGIDPKQK